MLAWLRQPGGGSTRLIAWITAVIGGLNLLDALIPREPALIERMEEYVPLEIPQGSQWLQAVVGLTLIFLARGLFRHKRIAWWFAVGAYGLQAATHLALGFDWAYAMLALFMVAWLGSSRAAFTAHTAEPSIRLGLIAVPIAAAVVFGSAFAMLHQVRSELSLVRSELWGGPPARKERRVTPKAIAQGATQLLLTQKTKVLTPQTHRAAATMKIVPIGGPVLALFALVLFLRPVLPHDKPSPADRARVKAMIAAHGLDPLDDFALMEDKHYFFSEDGTCVVVYAPWRDYAVTLADPIGPPDRHPAAMAEFAAFCRRNDWQPTFYEITQAARDALEKLGFVSFRIAEDARIDLTHYKLEGKKFQRHRTALNHAKKHGWQFRWYDPGERIDHGLEAQMKLVSDGWLAAKNGAEMTFDLGAFSSEYIALYGAAVLLNGDGRVEAFSTWMPFAHGRGRSLDLMRCRQTTNVMDANILLAFEHFRAQGVTQISLGNAPLANVDADLGKALAKEEKAVRYVYENFNKIYGYKTLFEFKDKYQPEWRPRYVAYRGTAQLPMIALAIAAVHTPGGLKRYLKS